MRIGTWHERWRRVEVVTHEAPRGDGPARDRWIDAPWARSMVRHHAITRSRRTPAPTVGRTPTCRSRRASRANPCILLDGHCSDAGYALGDDCASSVLNAMRHIHSLGRLRARIREGAAIKHQRSATALSVRLRPSRRRASWGHDLPSSRIPDALSGGSGTRA